jgi:hypothetical protein
MLGSPRRRRRLRGRKRPWREIEPADAGNKAEHLRWLRAELSRVRRRVAKSETSLGGGSSHQQRDRSAANLSAHRSRIRQLNAKARQLLVRISQFANQP